MNLVNRIDTLIDRLRQIECPLTMSSFTANDGIDGMIDRAKKFEENKVAVSEIKTLCDDEISFLQSNLKLNSVVKYVTTYRNAIKRELPDHLSLAFMKLSREIYDTRCQKSKEKTANQAGNLIFFESSNIKPYIARLIWLLKQDSYIPVSLGLMGLTGRRPTEILVNGRFKHSEKCLWSDNTVLFTGQLKKKKIDLPATKEVELQKWEEIDDDGVKWSEIPVLVHPDLVLAGLKRLRGMKSFDDDTPRKYENFLEMVHQKTASVLKKCFERYLSEFFPDSDNRKVYDLRAIYTLLCVKYCTRDNQSVQSFLSAILGHESTDLDTNNSYQRFELK
jgi:hypothetical protein